MVSLMNDPVVGFGGRVGMCRKTMNEIVKISKELTFALCPRCYWLMTHPKDNQRNCPECDAKLSIQKVVVNTVEPI